MKKEKWIYQSKYLIFYFAKSFDISFEKCGYFDNRPRFNFDLFFFSLTLILPFKNEWTDECDPPKFGISYHNETLWIYKGGNGNMNGGNKWLTIPSPFRLEWVRTSYLMKDGIFEHETKNNRKNFYLSTWDDLFWSETHNYTYTAYDYNKHSNDVIRKSFNASNLNTQNVKATIKLCEREWRPNWFRRLSIFKKISKSIDIQFDQGIGTGRGGTIGCSYELLPNETPLECLRRMENERIFK